MKKLFSLVLFDCYYNRNVDTFFIAHDIDEVRRYIPPDFIIESITIKGYYFEKEKVSSREMKSFADNLYILLNSGISAVKAIALITFNRNVDKFLRGVVSKVYFLLRKGLDFKDAFQQEEFDNYFVYSLKMVSDKKTFVDILASIKDYYNELLDISSEIKKSLIYPSTIFISIILLLLVLRLLVFPEISKILDKDVNFELTGYLIIILSSVMVLLAAIFFAGRKNDMVFIRIPFISEYYKSYIYYRFSGDMKLLIDHNIRFYNALDKVIESIGSTFLKTIFVDKSEEIFEGADISKLFENVKDLYELSFIVAVGNGKSGYKDIFSFMKSYYLFKFKEKNNRFMKLVEPILIIILSIVILNIAFEIYQNFYMEGLNFEKFF